ncbi:MAG: hypothetical protein JW751_30385 [Polyangiaceae bacterium]|nr:hypothetical protein [Polyangiaceae bacterium]
MAKMATHEWRFFRAGGVDQVLLAGGADVARLRELDQKLWVALACPTKGTEIDERTLALIDTDRDGRVRAPEILDAVDWLTKILKRLDLLFETGDSIPLAEIDGANKEGKAVLVSARRILADRGKKDSKVIGLADVTAMAELFAATRFNGDGVVPADAAEDEATHTAIEQVISAVGSVVDRSGKPGVDQQLLDSFFEQAAAVVAWDDGGQAEGTLPLGDGTAAAATALAAVESKVNDYFARCRIAAYDSRAAVALNASEAELGALSQRLLSRDDEDVAKLPVARIEGNRPLSLEAGLNPAWSDRIARFASAAVTPLLGARATLSERDYGTIVDRLAAFRAWQAMAPTTPVAALGAERLRELVAGEYQARLAELIAKDAALEGEYAQIAAVEKAVRLRRDFARVLRNFVNFADFYARKGAVFQAGTLYLDGRACDLVVYVEDATKHATLAGLSKTYLAYCECTRGAEKTNIAAAFTAGDVDNLMVGRNGVFYDRKGQDWDARITNLVENPISIRQAFWSPYKRFVRMIEEQVAKRAAEKEKASTTKVDTAASTAAAVGQASPGAAPAAATGAASTKKLDIGIVAAVGVAVAGLATFLSTAFGMFLGLGIWMPVGLIGVIFAISTPSMLIAWLKLRQRNLGPLLDANGWAINGRVRINVPFGGSLTEIAKLPEGASREVGDPYAEKPTRWWRWLLILILVGLAVAWALGKLDPYIPASAQAGRLLPRPSSGPTGPTPAVAPP